jgi:spermidine synthase
MVEVALDPSRFTFMSECQSKAPILVGDARLKLAAMRGKTYDVLLLDAFSSDSVPVHLVTREAMKIYFDRVGQDGVLIYNVSNRHIDLRPVLARTAVTFGATAITRRHFPTAEQIKHGATASEVVVVSLNPEAVERLRKTGEWQDLSSDGGRPWTDDYSNIVGAMLAKAGRK